MKNRHGVVILGAGNVASALAPVLDAAGYEIRQVFSRNPFNAKELASRLKDARHTGCLQSI
ncbi:MAG: NAD(P)-binding domain-containing protein, partial [Paramuribaculum sp.]|nr:NAD(P)-binding domain-containing protein [Paramuribaculum sp.]